MPAALCCGYAAPAAPWRQCCTVTASPMLSSHLTCLWVHAPAHNTLNQQLCWNLQRHTRSTAVNLITFLKELVA